MFENYALKHMHYKAQTPIFNINFFLFLKLELDEWFLSSTLRQEAVWYFSSFLIVVFLRYVEGVSY